MYYDLKTSNDEILIQAIDILLMRKEEYKTFLDIIKSGQPLPERGYEIEKLWHKEGKKVEEFDNEITSIQNELEHRNS